MAAYPSWFVCSLEGKFVRIYPAEDWQREKQKLQSQGVDGETAVAFAERFGCETTLDPQARILVPRPLFSELIGAELAWLYWRGSHILVLNERQVREQKPIAWGR